MRPDPKNVLAIIAISVLISTPSQSVLARVLEVGPEKIYKLPSEAAKEAVPGDKIVIDSGEYFDCAVVNADNVIIEGVKGPGQVVLTDKTCAGKGILVIAGNGVAVRNMTLARARVVDGNGAGIRAEGRNLTVEGVRFINNQNGILAGGGNGGNIIVRDSEFIRNGTCVNSGGCAHGIYVGQIDLLHIEHSKFLETHDGHHIKSRALRTEIENCEILDGDKGTASYLIDIPWGGSLIVENSVLEKGAKASNTSAAIVIGAEGVNNKTKEIQITGNAFKNNNKNKVIFIRNITATEAILRHNRIEGDVSPLEGDGVQN